MKLKELLNNEKFLSNYGDYEIVGELYKAVRANDKLQLVFDIQKPKPKSVWELNNKDEHYSVTECGFIKHFDASDFIGYKRDIGNVFATEEEANKEVERRKVETLLLKHGGRRWLKEGTMNWIIALTDDGLTRYIYNKPILGTIYFDTEEQAEKAINEIGEDRIIDALFEAR